MGGNPPILTNTSFQAIYTEYRKSNLASIRLQEKEGEEQGVVAPNFYRIYDSFQQGQIFWGDAPDF